MSNFENYRLYPPEDASPRPSPYYDVVLPSIAKLQVNDEQCLEFWFGCPIKHVVMFNFETISLTFYNADNNIPIVIQFNQREQFGALFNNYVGTVFGFSIARIYAGNYYKNYFRED